MIENVNVNDYGWKPFSADDKRCYKFKRALEEDVFGELHAIDLSEVEIGESVYLELEEPLPNGLDVICTSAVQQVDVEHGVICTRNSRYEKC